jgi:hypothetical protein
LHVELCSTFYTNLDCLKLKNSCFQRKIAFIILSSIYFKACEEVLKEILEQKKLSAHFCSYPSVMVIQRFLSNHIQIGVWIKLLLVEFLSFFFSIDCPLNNSQLSSHPNAQTLQTFIARHSRKLFIASWAFFMSKQTTIECSLVM